MEKYRTLDFWTSGPMDQSIIIIIIKIPYFWYNLLSWIQHHYFFLIFLPAKILIHVSSPIQDSFFFCPSLSDPLVPSLGDP